MSSTLSSLYCTMLINQNRLKNPTKIARSYENNPSTSISPGARKPETETKGDTSSQTRAEVEKSLGDIKNEFEEKLPASFSESRLTSPAYKVYTFEEEDNFIKLALTHYKFLRDRPILFYANVFTTLYIFAFVTPALYVFWTPGAIEDITRFSSGRFADFYCIVGLWVVLKFISTCAGILWSSCVSNDEVFKKAGTWAVVTGCTNGIGKEYALQLAAKGINIILISRNPHLLDELAREIGNEYGVRTLVIVLDFTTDDEEVYTQLANRLQNYDIGVLVNNVGITSDPDLFHKMPPKLVTDMINVNMLSLAKMCRIVLPGMAIRRRGIVINLSSALGTHPVSFVSLYGATKRFVDLFSRSIEMEFSGRNILVQSVTPYFISTNMTKRVDTQFFIPDAQSFVKSTLSTVGRDSKTYGYWRHALQGAVIRNLPTPMIYVLMRLMKYNSRLLDKRNAVKQQ